MNYAVVEAEDIDRVIAWFAARRVEAKVQPRHPSEPSPDLALWRDGCLVGHCEVKSLGLGPWDWGNAVQHDDDLLSFPGNYAGTVDLTKARLANAIVKAAKQVSHTASDRELFRVIAIVGHGPDTDVLDVQAVMRGVEDRPSLPPYRDADNPNRQIARARTEIDALVWLDNDIEHLMLNEADGERHARCGSMLEAS